MDRIERRNKLLFFGLFSIVVLIFIFFSLLQNYSLRQQKSNQIVYVMDEQSSKQAYQTGILNLSYSNVATINEIKEAFLVDLQKIQLMYSMILIVFIGIVVVFAYLFYKKQNQLFIQAFLQDIFDHKLEKGIPNKQKMAIYEQLKQHFEGYFNDFKRLSDYLSHEQKNMLALLRSRLEVHQQYQYIKYIDDMSSSIDDILTLSDDSIGMDLQETDCLLTVAEVCDTYQKLGHTIQFDFNEDFEYMIMAKKRWISRALHNLIENAIKYSDHKPIHVTVNKEYNSVVIIVSDNGIGISNNKLAQIFNNRYRIPQLNKDGYGIGLSLVNHVCDLCGGFIWVDSEIDKGSHFYVSLPSCN